MQRETGARKRDEIRSILEDLQRYLYARIVNEDANFHLATDLYGETFAQYLDPTYVITLLWDFVWRFWKWIAFTALIIILSGWRTLKKPKT